MHLFVVSSQVYIQWVHWIISMHPAELWLQSSLVDFQSYRNKTKKTSSFPTPLHPYPWIFFPSFYPTCILHYWRFIHIPLFISLPYLLPLLMGVTDMNSSQPSSDLLVSLPPPEISRFLSFRAHATHSGVTRTVSDSRRTCYLVTRL